ncbi:MAG TPA: glycoside hydrolase family 2 TIM barrel-domain containing protein [Streptosporangiaceae bacterium]
MAWRSAGSSQATGAEVTAEPPAGTWDFNRGWLFGGQYVTGAEQAGYTDGAFAPVTVPHTVVPLSWGDWDHTTWENVFIYRKHFAGDGLTGPGRRVFADFDGVVCNASVYVNGVSVATNQGGYLPFRAELSGHLTSGDNVLAVVVDARWLNVPPDNPPGGTASVDYLQPGGIYRDVRLRLVPQVFIADVLAQPVNVLTPARRHLRLQVTLDAARVPGGAATVTAQLLDGSAEVARAATRVTITATGTSVVTLTMTGLEQVGLWSPASPQLYTLRTTLHPVPGSAAQPHVYDVTTGFREAVFTTDGLYLNGDRQPIFGLNRHEHFPFLGLAACARLQRRDAEILKNELNCTMVRCSHYPQSPHFLDACDELGLMVWEETPGWNYVGDAAFQQLVLGNVHDMVVRDRNRPSVIMWGTRLNETANYVDLYAQTRQTADDLDGTRPTTGAMDIYSTSDWAQDVFGYDDYHSSDGAATLQPPLPGVPYLISEAVGALDGSPTFRWTDSGAVLASQGVMHAQVHDIAQGGAGYAGLLGWCAFDYASLNGGMRIWLNLKTPGVMDLFRVPKPGAGFYRSQVPSADQPVILPLFFWDYGPSSPVNGPGPDSAIATNCDRLELFVDGRHLGTALPDTDSYPNLACPPAFADLSVPGTGLPELRIDGYVGTTLAATVTMASDPARDRLGLTVDDTSIVADGSDTTRVTFRALDAYGHQRPYVTGDVTLALTGPGVLVGDNPFAFGTYGGVGGAFVRSTVGGTGRVTVTATHPVLGSARGSVRVTPATGSYL